MERNEKYLTFPCIDELTGENGTREIFKGGEWNFGVICESFLEVVESKHLLAACWYFLFHDTASAQNGDKRDWKGERRELPCLATNTFAQVIEAVAGSRGTAAVAVFPSLLSFSLPFTNSAASVAIKSTNACANMKKQMAKHFAPRMKPVARWQVDQKCIDGGLKMKPSTEAQSEQPQKTEANEWLAGEQSNVTHHYWSLR